MSLPGYTKKHRPAPWLSAFPGQATPVPPVQRRYIASRRPAYQASSARYNRRATRVTIDAHDQGLRCPVVHAVDELKAQLRPGGTLDYITQVHHIYGRGHGGRGPLLLDERLWLLCSAAGHAWIDAHPDQARCFGWLCPKGQYNTPVPATATVRRNKWGGVEVTL